MSIRNLCIAGNEIIVTGENESVNITSDTYTIIRKKPKRIVFGNSIRGKTTYTRLL